MVFIGELYRQTLISEAVIHRCLKSLLTEIENPEEEDIESLCKLLTSAGRNLDHPRAETREESAGIEHVYSVLRAQSAFSEVS